MILPMLQLIHSYLLINDCVIVKCLFYKHYLCIGLDPSLVQVTQTGSKGTCKYSVQ